MSTGARFDLQPVGPVAVGGSDYEVCSYEGSHGIVQVAWVIRAGIVVARVVGLVRGEPRICDKEPGLAWTDELDDEAAATVFGVWDRAGLVQGAVNAQ